MLFMDEPTTALTREINHLFRVIEQLKARNVATIFVVIRLMKFKRFATPYYSEMVK